MECQGETFPMNDINSHITESFADCQKVSGSVEIKCHGISNLIARIFENEIPNNKQEIPSFASHSPKTLIPACFESDPMKTVFTCQGVSALGVPAGDIRSSLPSFPPLHVLTFFPRPECALSPIGIWPGKTGYVPAAVRVNGMPADAFPGRKSGGSRFIEVAGWDRAEHREKAIKIYYAIEEEVYDAALIVITLNSIALIG
jgi:hypothetical protein